MTQRKSIEDTLRKRAENAEQRAELLRVALVKSQKNLRKIKRELKQIREALFDVADNSVPLTIIRKRE